MRDNDERQRRARAIAEVMEKKPNVTVTYLPSMIRIDGEPKLEFKMDEISEAQGRPMTPHLFEISTSTHYGRMVMVDDNTVVLFGNMDEALVYIEH
jgi:propane monooxygenase coupling protein